MSEQLFLPFSELSQSSYSTQDFLSALFFALTPPVRDLPRLTESIRHLRKSVGLTGEPLSPECFHVTLFGLGVYFELPDEIVAAARAAGAKLSAQAFEMILDRALTFPRKRHQKHPFVLCPGGEIAALMELHEALKFAMKRSNLKRWTTSQFTPHMTLSYDRKIISECAVETVRWRVNDLVLVHSLQGQGKHVHLARWPLH
jgi:RNA 2',3'-cyclic 3'-phosphodiesterase